MYYENINAVFLFPSLTLGMHAQQGLLYLGLCVCLSVLLLSHVVCPEIDITYSVGKEGQKICGVFQKQMH